MPPDKRPPICAITGATSGIGEATAVALAGRGMHLVLLCRNQNKARDLAVRLQQRFGVDIDTVACELGSLAAVRRAAGELRERFDRLDLLINNAGVFSARRELTDDGLETMFGVNHLGHYLLTHELMPLLLAGAPARIVIVASNAHGFVRGMDFDEPGLEHRFSMFRAYGRSKLANLLFARELARRLPADTVTVNSVHPGAVSTGLGAGGNRIGSLAQRVLGPFFRTPERGAESSIWCATSGDLAGISGRYFYDCAEISPRPWVLDDGAAAKLWQISADLVGVAADWPRISANTGVAR